jgi:hypothetical protein
MWYYQQAGVELGPLAEAELQSLVDQGAVTSYTAVRREGTDDWTSLGLTPLARLLHTYVPAGPDLDEPKVRPNRFGGGLVLLCFLLLFANPLVSILWEVLLLNEIADQVRAAPGLVVVAIINLVLNFGVTILGVIAGYRLWIIDPLAVRILRVYLIANLLYGLLSAGLPFLVGLGMEVGDASYLVVSALVSALFTFVIWISYVTFGQRVRKTFGEN